MAEITNELFTRIVDGLAQVPSNSSEVGISSVIVTSGSAQFTHHFDQLAETKLFDLRSISKVVFAMALGVAIAEGQIFRGQMLSLDTLIAPFFASEIAEAGATSEYEHIRLRHLISNTMGHRTGFLFRADLHDEDLDNLLPYIFSNPIEFEPGRHFSYSNAGWYLLSAMIYREHQQTLLDWTKDLLLSHLDIDIAEWKRYGPWDIGGSGLCLCNRDLHKLGRLFLQRGAYRGQQIVPAEWLQMMCSPVSRTRQGQDEMRTIQYTAYGYSMWINEDQNYFFCDGSAGQYLVVIPDKDLVISTVGDASVMNPISQAFGVLIG